MMPDLRPYFAHLETRMVNGTEVWFDFADKAEDDPIFGVYKKCGMLPQPEAEILFAIASQLGGYALDIGGLTGFTSMVMSRAGCRVTAIDPMYKHPEFQERASENLRNADVKVLFAPQESERFLRSALERGDSYELILIDGDHEGFAPFADAVGSLQVLTPRGAIVLHDTHGKPVQSAVELLEGHLKIKRYDTPFGLAVARRGDFKLP